MLEIWNALLEMSGKIALSYKILSVLKALTEHSDQAVIYICNSLILFWIAWNEMVQVPFK